jgi:ribose transport system permease protein
MAVEQPNWRQFAARFGSVLALVMMILTLSFASETFLSWPNILNILRQISINLCLSLGMTLVILTGGIDLSVGSILAISGAVSAGLVVYGIPIESQDALIQFSTWGAIATGMIVGTALGAFNGFVITRFAIPPFVATLGMLSIARGFTQLWTKGHPITGLGEGFAFIGTGNINGLPTPVWISGCLVAVFVVVARSTQFGRHLYAVGGNEPAARLSGIQVKRVKFLAYTLCGLLASIAGMIVTARVDSAVPTAGESYELDAIAAVVIGGTSLSGGRGSMLGTVLGCLIIGVLNNGLVLLGVSPFWQQIIKGCVILVAVIVDRMSTQRD